MKIKKKLILDELKELDNILNNSDLRNIEKIINLMFVTLKNNSTIFWAGNGGSAAECQHMSAELVGKFKMNRKPLKSISLTVDTSAITAIGNDFGFKNIFSRQIEALGKKNDILIVMSTSGNSQNIIEVLKIAKKLKIKSIAMLGNEGGKCQKLSDYSIVINSKNTPRIQELHQIILHTICEKVENKIFKNLG